MTGSEAWNIKSCQFALPSLEDFPEILFQGRGRITRQRPLEITRSASALDDMRLPGARIGTCEFRLVLSPIQLKRSCAGWRVR